MGNSPSDYQYLLKSLDKADSNDIKQIFDTLKIYRPDLLDDIVKCAKQSTKSCSSVRSCVLDKKDAKNCTYQYKDQLIDKKYLSEFKDLTHDFYTIQLPLQLKTSQSTPGRPQYVIGLNAQHYIKTRFPEEYKKIEKCDKEAYMCDKVPYCKRIPGSCIYVDKDNVINSALKEIDYGKKRAKDQPFNPYLHDRSPSFWERFM